MLSGITTVTKTTYRVGDDEFSDYQEAVSYLEERKAKASKYVWMSEYHPYDNSWGEPRRVKFVSVSDHTPAYEYFDENDNLVQSHCPSYYTDTDSEEDKALLKAVINTARTVRRLDRKFMGGRVQHELDTLLSWIGTVKRAIKHFETLSSIGFISDLPPDNRCEFCHGAGVVEVILKESGVTRIIECNCNQGW